MDPTPAALAFVSTAAVISTIVALVLRKVEQTKRLEERERTVAYFKEVNEGFNLLHSGACRILYGQKQPTEEELQHYLMQGLPAAMTRLSVAIHKGLHDGH